MIWHFVEIWALLFVAFAVGCGFGAAIYGRLARSSFATAQGAVADAVGDVVDRIKARLGVGPVWRPEYRHLAERPLLDAETVPPGIDAGGPDRPADETGDAPYTRAPLPETESDWPGEEDTGEGEGATAPVPDFGDRTPLAAEGGDPGEEAIAPPAPEPIADDLVAARPVGLAAPRNGVPDNLQKISGIGARNEHLLNSLGIFHFGQIAAWTPAEVKWIAEHIAFPERIERDDWIGQATILASGGDTGFSKSAERRRARRWQQEWDAAEDGGP